MDDFKLMMMLSLAAIPLVLLLRKPSAAGRRRPQRGDGVGPRRRGRASWRRPVRGRHTGATDRLQEPSKLVAFIDAIAPRPAERGPYKQGAKENKRSIAGRAV